ncbi:membrane protein insertase YidC [Oerskovia paurometabola]|uniref:Membrane protein insertase YidC n=1 Tax=Oerskovia paurometabola TaxID=162170 RepID=A0ABW1XE13_9CELL|nr:membrane protein insertase YidC [Oerskovia paurometabola]MBM7497382.1 YidC/Oxa1 family membrane protein insertase [Oerskovia paurometabola]
MPVVDALTHALSTLVHPIQLVVAWILVHLHSALTALGLDPAGGTAWSLAIVGLVVIVRLVLVPLVVVQVRGMRAMRLASPEIRRIQEKYRGTSDPASRDAARREQQELMARTGANPLAGCLPLLVQAPVLFALYSVLSGIGRQVPVGALTGDLVREADAATLLGAPLSGTLTGAFTGGAATGGLAGVLVPAVLIVVMYAAQVLTQRLSARANPVDPTPLARQQGMLAFVLPAVSAVVAVGFPVGVVLYWATSSLWGLGQQLVIGRLVPSGDQDVARAARPAVAEVPAGEPAGPAVATRVGGQRRQPRRGTTRKARRG